MKPLEAAVDISALPAFQIWSRVAEDFVPFDVNVATVNPGSFANKQAVRVVMCRRADPISLREPEMTPCWLVIHAMTKEKKQAVIAIALVHAWRRRMAGTLQLANQSVQQQMTSRLRSER